MSRDGELDTLLAAPLDDVADGAFSTRVVARIAERATWREYVWRSVPILAAAAIAPFLPLQELTDTALHVTPLLANSAAVAFAAGILAVTLSLEARVRETL